MKKILIFVLCLVLLSGCSISINFGSKKDDKNDADSSLISTQNYDNVDNDYHKMLKAPYESTVIINKNNSKVGQCKDEVCECDEGLTCLYEGMFINGYEIIAEPMDNLDITVLCAGNDQQIVYNEYVEEKFDDGSSMIDNRIIAFFYPDSSGDINEFSFSSGKGAVPEVIVNGKQWEFDEIYQGSEITTEISMRADY